MTELARPLSVPFSVADAEAPEFTLKADTLSVRFIDWQEQVVVVEFSDVLGVRWQQASSCGPQARDDEAYEIVGSEWLAEHVRQRIVPETGGYRHFKLCFNETGELEVLAARILPGDSKDAGPPR